MPDYKSMYFKLAAKVANAIELLTQAQLDGEDAYMDDMDDMDVHDKTDARD